MVDLDAYPDLDELLAASTVAELIELEDAQASALRTEAIIAVEAHTGQSFGSEGTLEDPVTKILDGSGGVSLSLPRRLEHLVALRVSGVELVAAEIQLGPDGDRLTIPAAAGVGNYYTRALEIPTRSTFGDDVGGVEVSGVWGWPEVPAEVTTALRQHMEDRALADAHALAGTIRSARALGLDGVRQGNLNFTLGSEEPELSARARRQLADLVWPEAAGFAV